jgi:hypothetical protein
MNTDSTAVFILGSHRSGTSCLAGSIQQMGVYLGRVSNKNIYNQKGSRENPEITRLNESILKASGGSWQNPPDSIVVLQEHIDMRDTLIKGLLAGDHTIWGIKDPRTLFTLPFWRKGLFNVQLVGTYRHPLSVARSLHARDGMPLEQGLNIWWKYNRKLQGYLEEYHFPLISFDTPEKGYQESLERIVKYLGLNSDSKTEMKQFYSTGLFHQPTEEKWVDAPEQIKELYKTLVHYEKEYKWKE